MVRPIPSLIQLVFSLSLLSFPVECQEVFTLTVSPEQSMAGLCPQRITFTCTTEDVNMLGTAIRWYFNNDPTIQNEFVFSRDQIYPLIMVQGGFTVVVESAGLNSDSSSVNAVVTLSINASTLVTMGITSVQCGRTLTTRIREVNVSNQLDDMESPSLSQLNLNATYADSRLRRVDVSSQQFYNLSNCEYKENTAINVTSQVGDTVCNVMSASSASCEYPMRPNSADITIQITATNSLGLSSFRNYTIPTISFINMSIAYDSLCNIRIECLNVSSQSRLDGCELFNTSSSYDDMMLITNDVFNVDGGKTYFFRAIYEDEVTTILQRNFTTESCANMNGPKEEKLSVGAIVGIAIAAVVIVAVIVIVIIGLLIFLVVKGSKRKRNYARSDARSDASGPTATYDPLRGQVKTSESPQKDVNLSEETNKSAQGDVDPSEKKIEEQFAQELEQLQGEDEHNKKLQRNDV